MTRTSDTTKYKPYGRKPPSKAMQKTREKQVEYLRLRKLCTCHQDGGSDTYPGLSYIHCMVHGRV